ncbi:hypothetical protein [Nocardia jinanensis]|uniref:Uncharacterized protein n=1 Tax=Nocardia jinanensis TaxID=382504 RepID=A0A917RFS3_9NOCA|nr:hypothetical protein [Nocardia jinanensis]GGL04194.1 hypothetical protein GCM10011588_18510 [Nocardia jinanensis]
MSEAPAPSRPRIRRGLAFGAAAAACGVFVLALGYLIPPAETVVSTDRLGPDQGEPVSEYLGRARETLTGADDGERWALVSFTEYRSAAVLRDQVGDIRIGQALYQVPLPRVATPLIAVQTPDTDTALRRSGTDAAWQLADRRRYVTDDRSARILEVGIARLRDGSACSPGIVVRAPLSRLRELSEHPGIRAVQALPADAVAGRFAVGPLLPDSPDPVGPSPDDGPIPPA